MNPFVSIGTVLAVHRQSWRHVCKYTEFHRILFGRHKQRHGMHQVAERNYR